MKIVFGNNIWISFLIGKRLAALRFVFSRLDVEIYYCDALEREYLDVAHRPKIMRYVDEKQVERVHRLMVTMCHKAETEELKPTLVRDPKDVYLLALSEVVKADYLITGDTDLLDLKEYKQTEIIDFETFLPLLSLLLQNVK